MAETAVQETGQLISPYIPTPATIVETYPMTDKERFFRFRLANGNRVRYKAGQFMQVSVLGIGEAPISICSGPAETDTIEMCVRAVGDVTNALHRLNKGDQVGLRGPFGNGFDLDQIKGWDCLFVAGGLGLAPCRSFIEGVLNRRSEFGKVTILYGARTPSDLLFREDLKRWEERGDCELLVTVDRADENWKGRVGLITRLFRYIKVDPVRTATFIIGPPVMFKFAVLEALSLGIPEGQIYCSLERRMKCGLGKCGHCQIRNIYVCQDGPIFSYQQVKVMREGI